LLTVLRETFASAATSRIDAIIFASLRRKAVSETAFLNHTRTFRLCKDPDKKKKPGKPRFFLYP
jgi:hypothetical protein